MGLAPVLSYNSDYTRLLTEKMPVRIWSEQPMGKQYYQPYPRKSAIEYSKSTCVKTHTFKLKILQDGLKQHECEKCKLREWNNKPIPLELHHVDGNGKNNNLSNIQLLCPNCHAQEPNNSGSAVKLNRAKLQQV